MYFSPSAAEHHNTVEPRAYDVQPLVAGMQDFKRLILEILRWRELTS